MKVKYNRISAEKEIPFDIEYLKDIFDDITTNNCGSYLNYIVNGILKMKIVSAEKRLKEY